jgi:hypothetical protein
VIIPNRRRFILASAAGAASLAGCRRDGGAHTPGFEDQLYRFPGRSPRKVAADVVVYGATPAGVAAAVEAAQMGRSVAIIGGWRERRLGGMMSGGLGYTDYLDITAYGGLSRQIIDAIADGKSPYNPYAFKPDVAQKYFENIVLKSGIAVYWSEGVTDVVKDRSDRHIVEISTADGRRVRGRVFIDASYEGDLLARAGVSFRTGREAADSKNPLNGFRGQLRTDGSDNHQFAIRGRYFRIDPFNVPGVPGSGLLNGVKGTDSSRALGSADDAIQAYNFRLTMTTTPSLRLDLPATPPDGYETRDYELLFRFLSEVQTSGLEHGRHWTFRDHMIIANDLGGGIFDINAQGGFSTDPFGLSWGYPNADYAQREKIWKAHERFTRGFFYALAWDPDPRVPDSLRREVRQWGLVRGYYEHPFPGDQPGWPPQLYVREARRMQSDFICSGADLDHLASASTPTAPDGVALTSYRQDSHHVQRLAAQDAGGVWRVWNEGNIEAPIAHSAGPSPLSYRMTTPNQGECSNLLTPFCVSATHQAFSAARVELTAMALGQACGAAAALICRFSVRVPVQQLPYEQLRATLMGQGAVIAAPTELTKFEQKLEEKIKKEVSRIQR